MKRTTWIFLILALLAISLRLLLTGLGFNEDMITLHRIASFPIGTNFYKAYPYMANWGPIPYWLFQFFYRLPHGENINTFHYYVAGLTTVADITTGWVLWKIWGLRAAALFLFSPAAAVIAGYHCNAEPELITMAMLGLYFFERRRRFVTLES